MQTVTTIGLDIAKSVFQVHGVDSTGHVVIRRQYSFMLYAIVGAVIAGFVGSSTSSQCSSTTTAEPPRPP